MSYDVDGEGREPRTWGTLVAVLYEADLSFVANELEKTINCANESEYVSRGQRRKHCPCMHVHAHLELQLHT